MALIAYSLGRNIVAAASPADAIAVMDRHEAPGRWRIDDVLQLGADDLELQVDESSPETVAEAIARLGPVSGPGYLVRWDYPADPAD
ncbi:hypothetical protein CXP40_16335 [Pseudomonas sp. YY-1]|uniref:hypothetical protein n=1 Tax=Pseudomonas sp. YY-1 TaxID=2058659 RepID=UPI000CC308F2|nr:hypothetical protein [Pseudomonas sp. YY-1]PKQ40342.1 hypothetical protein CXP40_16335 [Pseudomonas sp. YY-1]